MILKLSVSLENPQPYIKSSYEITFIEEEWKVAINQIKSNKWKKKQTNKICFAIDLKNTFLQVCMKGRQWSLLGPMGGPYPHPLQWQGWDPCRKIWWEENCWLWRIKFFEYPLMVMSSWNEFFYFVNGEEFHAAVSVKEESTCWIKQANCWYV